MFTEQIYQLTELATSVDWANIFFFWNCINKSKSAWRERLVVSGERWVGELRSSLIFHRSSFLLQRYYAAATAHPASAKFCNLLQSSFCNFLICCAIYAILRVTRCRREPKVDARRGWSQRSVGSRTSRAQALRRREVYLPKGVRNVSEAFRDTRIMRVRHARRPRHKT